jgi:hypothetical protein
VEPPQVAADLDPDREVLGGHSDSPIHLPERADTCDVVARGLHTARRSTAGVQFDDKAVCQDCAWGEVPHDERPLDVNRRIGQA